MNELGSLPPLASLFPPEKSQWDIKITVLGGGTGGPRVIRGLVQYPVQINSVTTMFDSGGSSGDLRKKYNILPPSDFTRAILAHLVEENPALVEILTTRFPDNEEDFGMLANHTIGNLMFLGLEANPNNERADAVRKFVSAFKGLRGTPHPVCLEDAHIHTVLEDGSEHEGEAYLDHRSSDESPIAHVYLKPDVIAYVGAIEAIKDADLAVLSMGSFYGSTVATMLPQAIPEALTMAGGVAYPLPLMTVASETNGYTPVDFVKRLLQYIPGKERLDALLVNNGPIPPQILNEYAVEGSHPVVLADDMRSYLKEHYCDRIIEENFIDEKWMKTHGELRHNSSVLAEHLVRVAHEIHTTRRAKRPSTDVFRTLLEELDKREVR